MAIKILGIDPALTTTGYGLISVIGSKLDLIEAGVITTTPKQDMPERLNKIYSAVIKLILETRPDVLVLEKLYAHYRHPTTAFLLGQARGVICLACAVNNIPLIEYGATRMKKAIVGAGQASKDQIQRRVSSLLNIKEIPKYNDVTDALALAIAHSYIANIDKIIGGQRSFKDRR